jgi:putative membrane protein
VAVVSLTVTRPRARSSEAGGERTWFRALGAAYLAIWLALAVSPIDRPTWALENLLAVLVAGSLFATRRSFPFSRVSYVVWFVFLVLHAVGAHFTYAEVPYDAFLRRTAGWSPQQALGWERNNYDRLVHFGFGLLLAYPAREVVLRFTKVRGFWGYALPFALVVSLSSIFELFEWFAALLFGEGLGMTYLGTQGDEWDAQKDVALATLGALLANGVVACVQARVGRDFAREWSESLRPLRRRPLGEESIRSGRV